MGIKSIWLLRREVEKRSGRPVKIESIPSILAGKPTVHDFISHEDVEKRFKKSLDIPFWEGVKIFVKDVLAELFG